MVQITLPDGSSRDFADPVSVHDVAQSIGSGLARVALGGRVTFDGAPARVVVTSFLIDRDASLVIITAKDPHRLVLIRLSPAHFLYFDVPFLLHPAQANTKNRKET